MARKYGLSGILPIVIGNISSAAIDVGEWEGAITLLTSARDEAPDELSANYAAWTLATFAAYQGDDIGSEVERLTAWAESFEDTGARASIHGLRAEAAFGSGRFDDACDEWLMHAAGDAFNAPTSSFSAGVAALLAADRNRAQSALTELSRQPGHPPARCRSAAPGGRDRSTRRSAIRGAARGPVRARRIRRHRPALAEGPRRTDAGLDDRPRRRRGPRLRRSRPRDLRSAQCETVSRAAGYAASELLGRGAGAYICTTQYGSRGALLGAVGSAHGARPSSQAEQPVHRDGTRIQDRDVAVTRPQPELRCRNHPY